MISLGSVKPSQTRTLTAFVNSKPSSQLSYHYLSLLEKDSKNNIEYPVYNVISDYIQDLKKRCTEVTLSDKEYYTYRFRPKLLADYLYGNGELYFIILHLNDMWSVKDFDKRTLLLLPKTALSEILSSINASEKEFINTYNQYASNNS